MRELVDILSVYLALALGLTAFWWGLFRNYPFQDCLIRSITAMAAVYVVGLLARFIISLFLVFGGRKDVEKNMEAGEQRQRTDGEETGKA